MVKSENSPNVKMYFERTNWCSAYLTLSQALSCSSCFSNCKFIGHKPYLTIVATELHKYSKVKRFLRLLKNMVMCNIPV